MPVRIDNNLKEKCQDAMVDILNNPSPTTNFEWKEIYSDDRRIFTIQPDNYGPPFVLKVRQSNADKPEDLDIDDLKKEFSKLQNAWTTVRHFPQNLTMSAPIRIWPEHYAMLVSYCTGNNLNSIFNSSLPQWLLTPSRLGKLLFHVGEWLGHYHSEMEKCTVPVMQEKTKYLNCIIKKIKQHETGRFSESHWNVIETRIQQSWNLGTNLKAGTIHGNFAFRNIMYTEDQIGLVDFENARVDLLTQDIGQLSAEIIYKCQYPGFGRYRKFWLKQFLNGYQTCYSFSLPELSAQIAYHLLLHRYELSQRKNESFARKMLSNYRIKYLNKQLEKWLMEADYWVGLK